MEKTMQDIKVINKKLDYFSERTLKHNLVGNTLVTEIKEGVTVIPAVLFISRAIYLLDKGVLADNIINNLAYPVEELPSMCMVKTERDRSDLINFALVIKNIVDEVSRDLQIVKQTIHDELATLTLAEVESIYVNPMINEEAINHGPVSSIMSTYLELYNNQGKEVDLTISECKLEVQHSTGVYYPEFLCKPLNESINALSLDVYNKEQVYKAISMMVNKKLHNKHNLSELCSLTNVIDYGDCSNFAGYIEKTLRDQLEMAFLIDDYEALFAHAKDISFSYFPGLKHNMTLEEWMLYQAQLHAFYRDNIIGVSIDTHNDVIPPTMSKHKLNHVDKLTITINKDRIEDSVALLIANARYHGIDTEEKVLRYAINHAINEHLAKTEGA